MNMILEHVVNFPIIKIDIHFLVKMFLDCFDHNSREDWRYAKESNLETIFFFLVQFVNWYLIISKESICKRVTLMSHEFIDYIIDQLCREWISYG